MPVSTAQRLGPSLNGIKALVRSNLEARTYRRILYLVLALPLGVAEFTFLVTVISFGFGTAVTLIGIPVLVASVYAWRWLADFERRLIGALLDAEIPSPYRPDPTGGRWWQRLAFRLADPATWKDLAFLLIRLPLGILSFSLAAAVVGSGLRLVLAPVYYEPFADGDWIGWLGVDTLGEAFALVPLGALILLAGIPALGALARLYGWLAAQLLGSNADPELTAQVTELQGARSRIIAAADDERRRIERDLHDGAQQRLVALALNLRMAEQRAVDGDPTAVDLVRAAGEEAQLALKELRDLARGIHPAILTNRGLPAALQDLASRATLPVEVVASPDERLPGAVEAAAYFVVSECLANIGKHANAETATVAVSAQNGRVTVEVADDGVGGAALDGGTGMQGLADRVGALSGTLAVDSPPGAGTRVTATIPLDGAEPRKEEPTAEPGSRMRNLRIRLVSFGVVAAVLVLIWALTGPDLPWIAWPLLGIGLVAGLDAWLVYASTQRGLRQLAGALVILNVFIVGVWVAAGAADYFWPAWVMVGSAIVAGVAGRFTKGW
ncbi:MAG TPA: sensor domain-containing protein [Thermoleophilaceae bacterium]|nr:sensor domain-containing protein [Thermoleophilaceae bacterium]